MKKILFLLLSVLFLASCATSQGFNRGNMKKSLDEKQVVIEATIKEVLDLKPQLPKKFRLAVYFKGSRKYGDYFYRYDTWTVEEKEKFNGVREKLKKWGVVSDTVIINDSLMEGEHNRHDIRMAAARAGADAVMIIQGVSSTDDYNNPLAATYCLIVTPLFVPGSVVDGLYIARASMWDVRNDYLYLSTEVEGEASETRPAAFTEEYRVIKKAKGQAIDKLTEELLDHVNQINNR